MSTWTAAESARSMLRRSTESLRAGCPLGMPVESTGMAVMMLGLGLAVGVPFMAIAAANFVVIVAAVHIPHEEAQLQRAFGGWYSDYAAGVRRWI